MASELAAALAKFQAALPTIAKGETAIVPGKDGKQGFKYTYADLADVSDAILPALGKLGLAFTSFPGVVDGKMCLVYSLIHVSGEERIGVWPLTGATPQQIGSAITYARRYSLMAVTGVFPGGEDDDGKAAAQAPQNGRVRTAHSDPEHTRLREPPVEDYGRGQRTRGPIPADQDRWDGQPAGPPLTQPEDQQGGIDGKQQARMFALFAEVGLGGRDDDQRGFLTETLHREVTSRKSLTWKEADQAVKALAEWAANTKLPGSAETGQVGAIASLYASKLGYKRTETPQMLTVSEQIIGRSLEGPDGERTHQNLSAAEARKLHDTLDGFPDRAGLEDWLKSPAEATP
jgi:hypothetical protein